jgi:hypothetical protein
VEEELSRETLGTVLTLTTVKLLLIRQEVLRLNYTTKII